MGGGKNGQTDALEQEEGLAERNCVIKEKREDT